MSSREQPRKDPPEKEKGQKRDPAKPRKTPKKEPAPTKKKDVGERGDSSQPLEKDTTPSSSQEQSRRHRKRKDKTSLGSSAELPHGQPPIKDETGQRSSLEQPASKDEAIMSSSLKQSHEDRPKKDETGQSSSPEQPHVQPADGSEGTVTSSVEPQVRQFSESDEASTSARPPRRHIARIDAPRKHHTDKEQDTLLSLPEPPHEVHRAIPPEPPRWDASEERSSSPGEACALPPEEYLRIAELARQSQERDESPIPCTSYESQIPCTSYESPVLCTSYESPNPCTSYDSPNPCTSHSHVMDPGSSSSPEKPRRHKYERARKHRDEKEGERRPRERRGRRESLRAVMARKKKEMQDALEAGPPSEYTLIDPYANSTASNFITRGPTGYVYDGEVLKHRCEWDDKHPETPKRLSTIMHKVHDRGLLGRCVSVPNYLRPDLFDQLRTKHSAEHYEKLKSLSQTLDLERLERDASNYDSVYFNRYTFDAACRALSSVLNLVIAIAEREVMNGMAFVRPPGHHAMFNEYNGYCFFNNVAIAAEACIKAGHSKRVMIIDVDVHHGQGTQQMFYDRKDVLYFSIHRYEHGNFWPNLPESNFNYIGKGEGLGYNINVPLNATGLRDDDYLAVVLYILLPVAYEFNPDLIILSAGYDAAIGCPEGKMNVTPGFYSHLISMLHGLARGKVAVVLEGGYFIPSLAEGAFLTLKTLIGGPCPVLDPVRNFHPSVVETIRNVRRLLFGKWTCFSPCEFYIPKLGPHEDEEDIFKIQYFGEIERAPHPTRRCYPENSIPEHNYYSKMNKALRERYRASVTLPITYVYDDGMLLHTPQRGDVERPERPERLTSIIKIFDEFAIDKRLVKVNIVKHNWRPYSPHIPHYMDTINVGLMQSKDVYVNEHTHDVVDTAVSGLLTILDGIMNGIARAGIAIIRPPGHHAEHNKPSGFCFVNNVAVAANYLQMKYNMQRVLIVDFDIHHGNGTQNMFYADNQVMYISIHKDEKGKFFPPESPRSYKYDGHGTGSGYNINIPFNRDKMGDTEYIAAFQNIVVPAAYAFAPQIILVSAGFDAGINDPLGGYLVNPETFGHLILMLKPLAEGRIILTLEGGYNLTTTSYAMAICAKALLGDPIIMPNNIYKTFSESAIRTIRDVMEHFKKHFDIFKLNKKLPHKPIVVKKVVRFTADMYGRDLTRAIDPSRVDDNEYVENEMRILNSSSH